MRTSFRTVALLLSAVAALPGLWGCSGEKAAPKDGQTAAATPQKKDVRVVRMSQCNLGEPWRVQMNKDIETAAKAHADIRMVFKDAQNDTTVQQNHVREFISQGVDLLIISPLEAAPLTGPVAEAYKKGIPVIVLDRAVLGEDFTMFIGADNKLIGEAAGRWVREKLGNQGKVVELMGLQTSIPGRDRHDGFVKGLGGAGIEVIFQADMKWLQPDAQREMESALARFPQIDLVYGHNDPGAYGAYIAAKAAGREKDMLFVGIDGLPHEGRAYVDQGILSVSFEYPTGGREAVDYALKILGGETVPKNVVLPSRFFTKENLASDGEWISGADGNGNG
ncbi:MAG: substrate-binding domain-containing protein [Candidatus Hydrogenedens sp.]|nr:substrate-binding domain-containing protein [Candidatus Hydrogenedens sp.]